MRKKRYTLPTAKSGELLVKFGREHGNFDLFYCYPDNDCGMKADSQLLMTAFEGVSLFEEKSLRQILIARGYDITTLKFSIQKLQDSDSHQ